MRKENDWPDPHSHVSWDDKRTGVHMDLIEKVFGGDRVGVAPFVVARRTSSYLCKAGYCVVSEKLKNAQEWWLVRFWWDAPQPPPEYQRQYAEAVRDLIQLRYNAWKEKQDGNR